jgi:hypothetical protein
MSGQSNTATFPASCQAVIGLAESGANRPRSAALSPDVTGWFSSPEQGVMFEAEHVLGPRDCSRQLVSLGPCAVAVLGSVLAEGHWWVELALAGERGPETCLAQFTLDGEERITEVVWLRASAVPGATSGTGEHSQNARGAGGSGDRSREARGMLEDYFGDLQASRFDRAAQRFGADGIYSHPPYHPGEQRVLWHGRDAIRNGFTYERGDSPVRQIITDVAQSGSRAFVRGVVEGVPNGSGGTFLSTAEFSESGAITRYVAFYSAVRF